jgi:hypothetical protein
VYRDEVLADSPVAYWRLNELTGTTAGDELFASNGSYLGGVALGAPGALANEGGSSAASFDSIDDSIFVSAAGALSMTSAVSIEVWVKRSRSGVTQAVAGKPTAGQTRLENYSLWFNAYNQIRMYVGNGTTWASVTAPTALDTNWHHVVGTFDNSTMRIYVDGVQKATTNTTVQLTPNANSFYVGRSSSSTGYNFGGVLDELAVYGTVLSPARVLAHYNAASSP